MKMNDYQKLSIQFALPHVRYNPNYIVMGLAAEAGEVSDKFAKSIRDSRGMVDGEAVARELGDVLWFVSAAAEYLGYGLEEIAEMNLGKLGDRKTRGVINGSGDDR